MSDAALEHGQRSFAITVAMSSASTEKKFPIRLLHIPRESFRVVDFEERVDSPGRYDLALCLEVAEHLPIPPDGG